MEKKYILTDETKEVDGRALHRIKAVRSFGTIKKGDLGGWVEKYNNLSHAGDCWVFQYAEVYGNALVYGNAKVSRIDDYIVFKNFVCGKHP